MNKKETPKVMTFSVPKGYEDEVAYVKGQPNQSRYIWELVKQDMKQQKEDNQILEIVRQAMSSINNPQTVNVSSKPKNVNVSNERNQKKSVLSMVGVED